MKKVDDIVIADVTGEGTMGKYTGSRLYPPHDEIAQLAFSFYESRGRHDGQPRRRLVACGTGTHTALGVLAKCAKYMTH
jgi:hypothetical protein